MLGSTVVHAASSAALTACATQWEYFRSEWHKKAIARDADQYRDELSRRLRVFAEDCEGGRELVVALRDLGLSVEVNLPRRPTLATVTRLKDAKDQNLSFRSRKDSESAADRDLSPAFALKAKSLSREDWLVIELMMSIRNVLAHSSPRSVTAMNAALVKAAGVRGSADIVHLARTGQRVTPSGIGRYLSATIPWGTDQESRVIAICTYMRSLGDNFRT